MSEKLNKSESLKTKSYGIKSVSASISTNYAQNLKEKEAEISNLENLEESKIIDSQIDEISLRIQK